LSLTLWLVKGWHPPAHDGRKRISGMEEESRRKLRRPSLSHQGTEGPSLKLTVNETLPVRRASERAVMPEAGLVRLQQILSPHGPIPVSKSAWWAGVKEGRFPKPVKLGPRMTAWRAEDIHALIQRGAS
jgi:prophage regulatory protein